jgi:peptidoglycan/xylan/chitin deacetylase (PgdA/CDA1 family)
VRDVTKVTHVTGGSTLSRRNLLLGLMGAAAVVAIAGCSSEAAGQAAQVPGPPPPPEWPPLLAPPPANARVLLPGGGVLSTLPGPGDLLALTLDDGVDTDVVRAYAQFAKDSGIRLTMFVTGVFSSWTDNRDLLRPLVDSGQIQLGNHTWLHHDLTKMTPPQVADELRHTDQFLKDTFGVDAAPYFRPPYGAYNDMVTKVATDLGYTVATLWDGTLGDDAILTPDDIVANAQKYLVAQQIVIGHLNHPSVMQVYHQFIDIIRERNLRTVTLNDVFIKPEVARLTSAYPG